VTSPHGNGPAQAWPTPFHVTFVTETGSTNADLLATGATLPHGTVLVADRQTAGRGRLDRTWESPPFTDGDPSRLNVLMSILLRVPAEQAHEQIRRVAIAAARACERVAGVRPELKWPNDLLLDGRKLAGILAQAAADFIVVGVGLNVAWAPPDAAHLPRGTRDDVVSALVHELAGLPVDITDEYRSRLGTLGRTVRVELAAETFEGTAVDVDATGALVIESAGGRRTVSAGDVIHVRPAVR
jgi:BirA family transcriptional regulator, biotin operon repressor / biotin---[acetyl-CoA-carboxylase] ligase